MFSPISEFDTFSLCNYFPCSVIFKFTDIVNCNFENKNGNCSQGTCTLLEDLMRGQLIDNSAAMCNVFSL